MRLELSSLDRSFGGSAKAEPAAANSLRQRKAPAQPHHCGLLHGTDCGSWSFMAAILWWILS